MNRAEFMRVLAKELAQIPEQERQEILDDYQTHFDLGIQEGKSEQQISTELGHPSKIAEEILSSVKVQPKKKTEAVVRTVLVLVALVFLNVNFVFPLAFSIIGVWAGISITSIVLSMALPLSLIGFIVTQQFHLFVLFSAIGLMGLGILLGIGMWIIAKFSWKYIKKYVMWNIQFVKGSM